MNNNFLSHFKEIAEISLKFATIGGLIIGLSQITIQLSTQRKDKVMQLFLKQYEEDAKISKIRSDLYRDFDFSKAHEILDETNDNTLKDEYEKFIRTFTKEDKDRYQKLLILTNFYNGIASCVESKLCQKETAKVLFQKEGKNFFQNYYPFFCHLNNRWEDELIERDSVEFYNLLYENKTFYENFCSVEA